MTAIREFFKTHTAPQNREEKYILLAVVSVFLPYMLSAAVLLFVILRALFKADVRKSFLKGFDSYLIVAFFALNLLSPILNKNYVGIACFFAVTLILAMSMYFRAFMTKSLFSRLCDAALFMSISSAIVAVIQRLFFGNKIPSFFFNLGSRAPSVFFNPNYYGAMITFVVLICIYRLIVGEGNKIFLCIVIAANIVGLLMADCQSAFFCIAFGIWLLLLFTKKYKLFIAVTILGIVGLCCLQHLTFIMPRIKYAVKNITIRSGIWEAGFKAFLDTPLFGRGMMGYLQIYETYGGQKNFHCHNLFIDMLLSFGIVGSIPLVWFAVKNVIKAKGKKIAPLMVALVGAVLLHGLVDVTLAWIQTGVFAVFLISCTHLKEED